MIPAIIDSMVGIISKLEDMKKPIIIRAVSLIRCRTTRQLMITMQILLENRSQITSPISLERAIEFDTEGELKDQIREKL